MEVLPWKTESSVKQVVVGDDQIEMKINLNPSHTTRYITEITHLSHVILLKTFSYANHSDVSVTHDLKGKISRQHFHAIFFTPKQKKIFDFLKITITGDKKRVVYKIAKRKMLTENEIRYINNFKCQNSKIVMLHIWWDWKWIIFINRDFRKISLWIQ